MARKKKTIIGRPIQGDEPKVKCNVTLEPSVAEALREFGDGNLSAGIALAAAEMKTPARGGGSRADLDPAEERIMGPIRIRVNVEGGKWRAVVRKGDRRYALGDEIVLDLEEVGK